MNTVFIDGKEGTTGLKIFDRLAARQDIKLITLPEGERKDPAKRREAINASDVTFLCLPDAAAREAVSFAENDRTKIIDTSTAHRTEPGWVYGFPELDAVHESAVQNARRVAVPGCHASGFVALVYPLVKNALLSPDARLCCHSLTGYSGGGKKMIAEYRQARNADNAYLSAPRQYGITQLHKHLKEMKAITGLLEEPAFSPIVADYYSGMLVTVPLFRGDLQKGAGIEDVKRLYKALYCDAVMRYTDKMDGDGFVSASALSERDYMEIAVAGNEERMLLLARFDNLGKGASGAAVECMNLMLGLPKTTGLAL